MFRTKLHLVALLVVALSLVMTACGAGPIKSAYTASGDINDPDELTKTQRFRPDDDLNVVVTLNSHSRELPLRAVFTPPANASDPYATDVIEVGETAGVVILGLDWEMAGATPWPEGEWSVDVYVDDEKEHTLSFEVQPVVTTPAG